METYMMMLYVSLEQEQALKQFFMDNGWEYCKPDLSALTDSVGPLVAQVPHTKKSQATRKKQESVPKKTIPQHSRSSQTPDSGQEDVWETPAAADSETLPNTSQEPRAKKRRLSSLQTKTMQPSDDKVVIDEPEPRTTGPTVNLDGTFTMDAEPIAEMADASTVMDSSGEENRSNGDDSDWELFNKTVAKSKKSKPRKKIVVVKQEEKECVKSPSFTTPVIIKKETFSCDYCDKTFTIQRHLKNHCKKVHDVAVETDFKPVSEEAEKVYECDLCDCSYTRVSSLKQHQRTKHGASFGIKEKPFSCNVCFLKYDTSHFLELHQADKHGKVLNGKEVEHECKECGATFEKYRAFRLHRKQHEKTKKKHVCEVCGRIFGRADSLLAHRKFIHLGMKRAYKGQPPTEKKFVCEICGSGFFRRSNLNEHFIVKHSNEPLNHKCEHCDKTFNRPSLLEYHVNKVHLKQKPYTCDKCEKKSFSKHALHEHKLLCSMTVEKKIKCDQCGKLFTTRHNYKLHMQAVHSNPALVCPCGTVVRWQSSVTKHKRRCSLYNSKVRKSRHQPVEFVEQVLDVEDGQAAENAAVVYLQNQIGETGEEYTEIEGGEEVGTTVVVSEAEAEVAESVSKLLEAIPGATLADGGERQDVTVVEEQVVDGGEASSYSNTLLIEVDRNLLTGEDNDEKSKEFFEIARQALKIRESSETGELPTTFPETSEEVKNDVNTADQPELPVPEASPLPEVEELNENEGPAKYYFEQNGKTFVMKKFSERSREKIQETGPFKCALCKKEYSVRTSLQRHLKSHQVDLSRCSACNQYFSTEDERDKHNEKYHPGANLCETCGAGFSRKSALRKHALKFHPEHVTAKFTCPFTGCKAVFDNESMFSDHLNVHQDYKPHVCGVCEKAFALEPSLKAHMAIHSGEGREVKCDQCSLVFKSSGALSNHRSAVHNNIHYICRCGKMFKYKPGLIKHIKQVHDRGEGLEAFVDGTVSTFIVETTVTDAGPEVIDAVGIQNL